MAIINPAMDTYNLGVCILSGLPLEGKATILRRESKEFASAGSHKRIVARLGGSRHGVCVCGVDIPRMS